MLNELGPWLTKSKATDLINRIDSDDPDQALPGEYELGIGWALSKVADVEFEPVFGGKSPDFITSKLFTDGAAVIEVVALSDDALSGESSMQRTANIINGFADSVRKKASKNLHYHFLEKSGYRPVKMKVPIGPWTHESRYFRNRLTSKKFKLTAAHETQLRQWLSVWPPHRALRIDGDGTAVVVTWKKWVHPQTRTFSSMPSVVYDLKKNPIYERLKEKEKQLASVPADHLKCVVLGDAGCTLLREPRDFDGLNRRMSGKDIIQQFLADSAVDIVCIFTPKRASEYVIWQHNNPRRWHLYYFAKQQRDSDYYNGLLELNARLPAPYLHGYQARSWMQQGMLSPQSRGQYLATSFTGGANRVTAKISARALFELLAGRINEQQFKHWVTGDGDKNVFDRWLSQGHSISDVSFERKGTDGDDDYIVIAFDKDPNASSLALPTSLRAEADDNSRRWHDPSPARSR